MSFRRRTVLLAAGAVAGAIVIAAVVVYVVTGNELSGQINAGLRATITPGQPQAVQIKPLFAAGSFTAPVPQSGTAPAAGSNTVRTTGANTGPAASPSPALGTGSSVEVHAHVKAGGQREVVTIERKTVVVPGGTGPAAAASTLGVLGPGQAVHLQLPAPKFGGPIRYVQLYEPNGNVLTAGHGPPLPLAVAAHAVAAGRRGAFFTNVTIAGTPARVLTERGPAGAVWLVAQPLADLNNTLAHLRLVLALVCLGGIALAAGLGLLVSRAALEPLRRFTGAAEDVARTHDLGHRIEVGEDGELGRLSASFNTMLAALERARLAQRQLISDASHELRTPLTSVQANLDALATDRLPERERQRTLTAARAQLRELTTLVGDLIDLSKTEVEDVEVEDVRLDLAAAAAISRARLHAPGRDFVLDAEPCLVRAAPGRLDRAIANLLDNAAKWSPPAATMGPVEVRVREGTLEVRDHGPGIAEQDLERVFDRFYRAPDARGRPGCGLGLAIVRQMAEAHGGSVHAANDPGGGARLTLRLPALAMSAEELVAADGPQGASGEALQEVPRVL